MDALPPSLPPSLPTYLFQLVLLLLLLLLLEPLALFFRDAHAFFPVVVRGRGRT